MTWKEKHEKEIQILFDIILEKFSISKEELISNRRKTNLVITRIKMIIIYFDIFYKSIEMKIKDKINEIKDQENRTEEEEFEIKELIKSKPTHNDIMSIFNRDRTLLFHYQTQHDNDLTHLKNYKKEFDSLKDEYINRLSTSEIIIP